MRTAAMVLGLLVIVTVSNPVTAQRSDSPIVFAGIKWGSTIPNVRSYLERKDYRLINSRPLEFEGIIAELNVRVIPQFSESNRLCHIQVVIDVPFTESQQKYAELREVLRENYGESAEIDDYGFPLIPPPLRPNTLPGPQDSGYLESIKAGVFKIGWSREVGTDDVTALRLNMIIQNQSTREVAIVLDYLGPLFFSDQRQLYRKKYGDLIPPGYLQP